MNDCSTFNSSLSDTCHYVKIICSIKFQRGGHRLFMVFRPGVTTRFARASFSRASFARSCLALSPLRGEMTFITRCPGGKKPKDKSHNLQEYNFTNIIQIHEAKNTTPEMEEKMRSATGKGRNETEPIIYITARRAKPCPHLMYSESFCIVCCYNSQS